MHKWKTCKKMQLKTKQKKNGRKSNNVLIVTVLQGPDLGEANRTVPVGTTFRGMPKTAAMERNNIIV